MPHNNRAEASQQLADISTIRLSTDHIPVRDRTAMFCDLYARQMLRVQAEPLKGQPFLVDLKIKKLHGLDVITAKNSPLRVSRTKEMLSDGNDAVLVNIARDEIVVRQRGREAALACGDAVASSTADEASIVVPASGNFLSLFVPRAVCRSLLREPEDSLMRTVPNLSPALRLLVEYLGIVSEDHEMTPDLQDLAVAHVYDLLALALGPTRDASYVAVTRGVPAARLRAIKKQIVSMLDRDLSVQAVAAHHRISSRYVRKLFEGEGTTFTDFLREQRLLWAHRMLSSWRFDSKRIAEIAFDAGFSDVSYFNRVFRRRFDLSPGELRQQSISMRKQEIRQPDSRFGG